MSEPITLAIDVSADPSRVFEVLTTSDGHRGFWTDDCDVTAARGRFGFAHSPVDVEVAVSTEADRLVRMVVTSGPPARRHSSWEWVLSESTSLAGGTTIVFRDAGTEDGATEVDLGRRAQTWALVLDRLAGYIATGDPQPYFTSIDAGAGDDSGAGAGDDSGAGAGAGDGADVGPSVRIPLHDLLGLDLGRPDRGPMAAEVSMPIRPEAFGFTANLHGGAVATLVDVACAFAAAKATSFDPSKESLVTADMHVRYLGRPRTAMAYARAEVVRIGSQLIVIECKVVDDDDHLIAVADFSMMRVTLRRPLSELT